MAVAYGSLPFSESISFFKAKLNLPTEHWNTIWQGAHSQAFVVAGAMQHDLLVDLRTAVDKAINNGQSLTAFRGEFKQIVAQHGWAHNGNANWRAKIIYTTNMRQAHNTGRWQQLQQLELWQYKHGDSITPRPHHLAWDGTLLAKDDPWWSTHFPQNGWGCRCKVIGMSRATAKRRGIELSPRPNNGKRDWVDKQTGEVHQVPNGIDPGFDYSVGEAHRGRHLSDEKMTHWQAQKADAWHNLSVSNWQSMGLAERLPLQHAKAPLGKGASNVAEFTELLTELLGSERILNGPRKRFNVYINSASFANHVALNRARFAPLLIEMVAQPQEIWGSFEQHKGTGRVEFKQRYIKTIAQGRYKGMLLVVQVVAGLLEAWTVMPLKSLTYLNKQRRGLLLWQSK